MSKEFVDVIIPTHNGMPWLKGAVDSALKQSHKQLFLYIIDDGSSDDTEKYINSISDKRVRYIKKQNGGVSSARNLGIKKSDSPYIAFLDSDDIWHVDKLKKQLDVFQKNKEVGMVYGHMYLIDDEDIIQGNLRQWYRGHITDDLVNGNFISGSASMVLVKRSILERTGYFREDVVNGEDWELWLRISRVCEIDFVPEIIASIRQHGSNAQANIKKMSDGLVYVYDVMIKSHTLTVHQQRRLASYCLFHAAISYYEIKEYYLARKTIFRLFKENPPAIKDLHHWGFRVEYGVFLKLIFNNPLFRLINSVFRVFKRILRKIIGKTIFLISGLLKKLRA